MQIATKNHSGWLAVFPEYKRRFLKKSNHTSFFYYSPFAVHLLNNEYTNFHLKFIKSDIYGGTQRTWKSR
jgi:hypothetical protein